MTVQELIIELMKIEDKNKTVFIYDDNEDIKGIELVDEMDDRVDLNTKD